MEPKKRLKSNDPRTMNILYIVESLLFLVLCFFFVPKIDDVIFKYNEFFQFTDFKGFLHSTVYYGNGRFLGNGLCILFSRIPKIFYFVEFALVQVFCFAVEKLTEIKNSKNYFLMVFILQPIFFVNQVESWLCGFINYFVPTLLLVIILIILKKCAGDISKPKRVFSCVAVVILGLAEQLFVQHNAVMNLVIAVTVLIIFIRKKKSILESVLLIISNIAGCILLFGYKYYVDYEQTWVYKYTEPQGTTILSLNSIGEMVKVLVSNIGIFVYTYFACIAVYTILMAVILHIDKKDKSIKLKKLNVLLMLLYYPIAAIVFVLHLLDKLTVMRYAVVIAVFFVLNLIGFGYSFIKAVFLKMPVRLKITSAIVLFYALASVVPFLIYTTSGAFRGIWFAYTLVCLFTLIAADFARREYEFKFEKQLFVFSICACIVTACYIPAYAVQREIYNYKAENYKTEYYLPSASRVLVDQDMAWDYAEGNIEHEFISYKEFCEMNK